MAAPKKAASKKNPIAINPANEGKLRAKAGTPDGKKIPAEKLEQMKNSPNKKTAAQANFALNARKWKSGGK